MRKLILFTATLLLLASCYRKPLYDECMCSDSAEIPISIDWEPSGVAPKNVSVLIYDSESGDLYTEHYYEDNDNEIQSYVYLPLGNYTAVVFNEMPNQIDYLSCNDYENLSTINFSISSDSKATVRATDDSYIQQPGDLAVQVIEGIEVTEELIIYTYEYSGSTSDDTKYSAETKSVSEKLMGLIPTKKTSIFDISVHVKNLCSAASILTDLRNISDGYHVTSDLNSTNASTIQFVLNSRVYDDVTVIDGTIYAQVILFGSLGERLSTSGHTDQTPIELDILFTLGDVEKTEVEMLFDITNKITFEDTGYSGITLTTHLDIEEALPEIVYASGDFGADVTDWESGEEFTSNLTWE